MTYTHFSIENVRYSVTVKSGLPKPAISVLQYRQQLINTAQYGVTEMYLRATTADCGKGLDTRRLVTSAGVFGP